MTAKHLFDHVNGIGEILEGDVHIIDTTEQYPEEDSKSFRVYHKNGYCFDIKKEFVCHDNEVPQFQDVEKDGYYYSFYTEWDGFKKLNPTMAIALLMDFKTPIDS